MKEDLKELSLNQKRKFIDRRKFWISFAKCIGPIVFSVIILTLYAFFTNGNFINAFTTKNAVSTIAIFLINFFLLLVLFFGIYSFSKKRGNEVRDFLLVLFMVDITFIASMTTARYFSYFCLPIALVALVIVELVNKKMAFLSTVIIAVLIVLSFVFTSGINSFPLKAIIISTVCNGISALNINFFVDKHFTRIKFLLVSLFVSLIEIPFVIFATLAIGDTSIDILWNILWSYGGNIGAIMLFLPLVAIFEAMFNIADDFRLNELCSLNTPLLKRLASEAPGTFNHSLVVGNLAEACATAIGENPQLARCAAYYHDIGKLKAPIYFSENQSDYNPHDELIPEVSVSMITSHTLFGEILAKQNRLPPEIIAIARQHHGTAPVGYFYRKALTLTEEGELAVDNYKYSGPKPQTKVAAIIMIADTIEAALRSYIPKSKEDFESRINVLVDEKLTLGQFDECPITMSDINTIKMTIAEVLPSIHHSRVSYDNNKKSVAKETLKEEK